MGAVESKKQMARIPLIFAHRNASREGEHGGICDFLRRDTRDI